MAKLKLQGSKRKKASRSAIGCPIFLNLFRPTLADIPVGAAVRPGLMVLEICTPPVFGEAKNERRFLQYPVYPAPGVDLTSPAAAVSALWALMSANERVSETIEELKALARTPSSRAWARANPDYVFGNAESIAASAISNSQNSK
jgi:hypothetical protein